MDVTKNRNNNRLKSFPATRVKVGFIPWGSVNVKMTNTAILDAIFLSSQLGGIETPFENV